MIPSQIIAVDEFPLNKNRKLDAAALMKDIHLERNEPVPDKGMCESHVLKVIKTVWSEMLGVSDFNKTDNFFSVGGTSLTAVILSRKLGIELCTDVSVQDVFQYQTISSFAEHIETMSDRPIHGMPAPLTFLDGGCNAMNRYVFTILQILGLCLMTILVAVPLLASTFVSIRSILWFGAPGIFFFPLFVMAGCLVSWYLCNKCQIPSYIFKLHFYMNLKFNVCCFCI